ncbi:tRNA dihydrouridine synthase DusB [Candidatus Uhrbacteria bacterium]|nr:tRNA dihydrouridine synthase DusB [Candidatus Uhrbacteria bacterium]
MKNKKATMLSPFMELDWKSLPRPIIALSPMADMTDSAFCRTVRSVSTFSTSPIVFREMVSSEAVVRRNNKTITMTNIHPDERPIVQQLFGSDPDTMAEAARIIEAEHHPEGFDVNMGCPVYKIVHNFNGAALMREPELATKIIKKMKAAIMVPLSIKIRTGWDDPRECFAFAKVIEDAGADMITIHGRTKTQGYSGQSDWNLIGELKSTLSIPVLGNGDIHSAPLTLSALNQTKTDGVLIARGALGNPWIFSQIADVLQGKIPTQVTLEERIRVIKAHLAYHLEQYGPAGIKTFRKHLSWYFRGVPGARPFKERLHTTENVEAVHEILNEILLDGLLHDALSDRDAMNPVAAQRVPMAK